MENKAKKYELNQNGKKYILSTQTFQDKLRFACIEDSPSHRLIFIGEFTLIELSQINSIFSSLTEISEAQEIFNRIIVGQKVSIEINENYLNLTFIIKREQTEEQFIIKLKLLNNIQAETVNTNNQQIVQNQTNNIDTNIIRQDINKNNFNVEGNTNLDENLLHSPIHNYIENEKYEEISHEENMTSKDQNISSPIINSGSQEKQLYNSPSHIHQVYNEQIAFSPNISNQQQYFKTSKNINENIQEQQYIQSSPQVTLINNNIEQHNLNIVSENADINSQHQVIQSSNLNQGSTGDKFIDEFLKNSGNFDTQNQYIQQKSENNMISSQAQYTIHNINNNILSQRQENINMDISSQAQNNIQNNNINNTTNTNNEQEQYIEQHGNIINTQEENYFHQSNPEIISQDQQYIETVQHPTTNITSNIESKTQTQYVQIPTTKITTEKQYIIGNQTLAEQSTNYNVTQNQVKKTKRIISEKIVLPLKPMPQEAPIEPKIEETGYQISGQIYPPEQVQETNYETSAEIYSTEPVKQQEIQIQQIIPQNNQELDNLKDENGKLKEEINLLKDQINIYVNEIRTIKKTSIKQDINNDAYQQILYLKQENERYMAEIERLRKELNGFNEYKIKKEQDINILQVKIQTLLNKIHDLEKSNEDLRAYISKLSQKGGNEGYIQGEALTIQDTRLEIIRGDIIENAKELELLTRKICSKKYKKISLNLLYKAIVDSDKAQVFHKKCDSANNTLVLVKSGNNKRFGGYTSCNWQGNAIEKKDDKAFVFSLDKKKIYNIIKDMDAIGCYPKYGPIFLGCQIRIYDEFFKNGGTTFEKGANYETEEDYELSGGLKKFDIKDLEVYSVEFE